MKREEFDRILEEEGVKSKKLKAVLDELWRTRPSNGLDEKKLRKALKFFKTKFH